MATYQLKVVNFNEIAVFRRVKNQKYRISIVISVPILGIGGQLDPYVLDIAYTYLDDEGGKQCKLTRKMRGCAANRPISPKMSRTQRYR